MSPGAEYEVSLLPSALKALRHVDRSLQRDVADVLENLGTYLERYPDRTHSEEDTFVYTHRRPKIEVAYTVDESRCVIDCSHVAAPLSRPTAFVSYSHKNRKFLEEFRKFMNTLEKQGLLEFWHDGKIESGADWDAELQAALRSAKAAVLLVTQDFLVSEYILEKELPILEEHHNAGTLSVHWVHVERSAYKTFWFAQIQALCPPEPPLKALKRSERLDRLAKMCDTLERHLTS